MATIVGHLSIAQLQQRVRAASDAVEAKHFQAIRLLAQGRTFVEVADILALVPRWVEELAQRYNRHGPAALGNQRRNNGRAASVLTAELLTALTGRGPVDRPEGGGMDRPTSRPRESSCATRLGSAEEDRLVDPGAPTAASAGGDAAGARCF